MDWDSLIFTPRGGSGEFSEIAEEFRKAHPIPKPSCIVPIHHIESVHVVASHLGLDAMDARGYFAPLALVPLAPFGDQPRRDRGLRFQPLFRLSWYGHPLGGGT